jgi:ketosteroid isomerase-like protein
LADALDVAERLFAAIEAGDVEAVRSVYAPDAEIWHNHDGVAQSVDENLRVLGWLVTRCSDLRYTEVRRSATDGGFVQQHVLRLTSPAGEALAIPACIVGTVVDGRIARIDEYLDSAQIGRVARG